VVQQAVAEERKLAFDYTRADGQKGPRTVDPLGVVAKGLSWYLVAKGANGMRTYRVSRMEAVTPLASKFERPAQFDLASYWKESTAQFEGQRGQYAARLRVAPGMERTLSMWCTRWAPLDGQDAVGDEVGDEGWVTVKAEFESEGHARFVVLGLGARARVIEPVELRRSVAAEVEAVAGRDTFGTAEALRFRLRQ
jgi:predicted DNA-binding transcriptional regulator YafY